MKNINTKSYWDLRFGSGDWERKGGYNQTELFAQSQTKILEKRIQKYRSLCDFGCGAGDSFHVYHKVWPKMRLVGVDFSESAIKICRSRYSSIASFECGGWNSVPIVDCIICSNVLEHVDSDTEVVDGLLPRCERLFVIVPFREEELSHEHLRSYNDSSFDKYKVLSRRVFASKGWSEFGIRSRMSLIITNGLRALRGLPIRRRRLQIMFEIEGRKKG